jgi:AAA+ ATPase superfamily predicted ATPase
MEYKKEPAFINRQAELAYLNSWIEERPEQILFLYGPKSSGKTTLIYRFIEDHLVDKQKFSIKHFNLRKVLIVNYEDFLDRFFQVEEAGEQSSSQTRQYDIKVFKLTVESQERIKKRQLDPFDVMEAELKALNKNGIKPLIIIDELQALDFIYFNSQRELIKELINFFVAMTKESHLCHVLMSSSDGYFIEKLYNDSKLKKTSKLFEVDYLPKEDIVYWLNNLEKESKISDYVLTDDQIEYIWYHFGGSIWEISTLLGDFLRISKDGKVPDEEMQGVIAKYMVQARSYFEEYAALDASRTELLREVLDSIRSVGCAKEAYMERMLRENIFQDKDSLQKELHYLVRQNFLYYNPTLAEYKLQGRSMEIGLEMYLCEVDNLRK